MSGGNIVVGGIEVSLVFSAPCPVLLLLGHEFSGGKWKRLIRKLYEAR